MKNKITKVVLTQNERKVYIISVQAIGNTSTLLFDVVVQFLLNKALSTSHDTSCYYDTGKELFHSLSSSVSEERRLSWVIVLEVPQLQQKFFSAYHSIFFLMEDGPQKFMYAKPDTECSVQIPDFINFILAFLSVSLVWVHFKLLC